MYVTQTTNVERRLIPSSCDGIFYSFLPFIDTYTLPVCSSVFFLLPAQTQSELASDPTMRHLQRLEEGQAHSQAQVRSEHKRYEVCARVHACVHAGVLVCV